MTERVIQSKCNDSRLDAITKTLLQQATQCVTTKGVFNLMLSDSEELDAVYARLMYDPDLRAMPWNETQLWFLRGEEESIVLHSGIPEDNVHSGTTQEQIDCMVIALSDIDAVGEDLRRDCVSFLIYANSDAQLNWSNCGVAHLFCI
ncbi:MAG: hypothetical protein H8E83_07105 [Planctomycetes bacterium]|nr:hypothetical protein [Planctomycetota bacterium]